ncbi:hypothetical protein HN512_02915 [Candidatus Peregrinibacteria bacterium]|jgi:hypothetical protein|nr:hypothetical protein [Candidatus Peregrinibacteria bacterium]MBT3598764.1 hypothetical protein [Candidatus Peregrinibacteria bacterium]MBT4367568.1 hypothetical protein [Candidatus Peregrinibacteria bacterium]MBT4585832.1 hypothetical protein [Candidatus Peregrinibacteria bacterium]MBT6731226.1 hypothetical protein [Candidatus Peregrinibacteria bacterium]
MRNFNIFISTELGGLSDQFDNTDTSFRNMCEDALPADKDITPDDITMESLQGKLPYNEQGNKALQLLMVLKSRYVKLMEL